MVFISSQSFAQSPKKLSYQAVIRNSADSLVTNHIVGMRISILHNSATGTPVYVETQTPTTNANGLVSIEIGGGTLVSGSFSAIDWANGPYFIKTETDPTGSTSYTITGTSQLLSVPYALYAESSGDTTMWKKNASDIYYNNGKVGIGTASPGAALDVTSTTGAFMPPRMTTIQRDALTPLEGMIIYNTSISRFQGYQTGASSPILQIDTGSSALALSIVAGYWIMHQSFTAPMSVSITDLEIVTDATQAENGTLQILAGNGTGGSVLYTQSITYANCVSGICVTHINLATPFAITSGTAYTLKFTAATGGFSTFTNMSNPYPGGQVYHNSTSLPQYDLYLKIFAPTVMGWVNFY